MRSLAFLRTDQSSSFGENRYAYGYYGRRLVASGEGMV